MLSVGGPREPERGVPISGRKEVDTEELLARVQKLEKRAKALQDQKNAPAPAPLTSRKLEPLNLVEKKKEPQPPVAVTASKIKRDLRPVAFGAPVPMPAGARERPGEDLPIKTV